MWLEKKGVSKIVAALKTENWPTYWQHTGLFHLFYFIEALTKHNPDQTSNKPYLNYTLPKHTENKE